VGTSDVYEKGTGRKSGRHGPGACLVGGSLLRDLTTLGSEVTYEPGKFLGTRVVRLLRLLVKIKNPGETTGSASAVQEFRRSVVRSVGRGLPNSSWDWGGNNER